jgi:SPOR domain
MLERLLRRDPEDPYLDTHSREIPASLYDEPVHRSFLHQHKLKLLVAAVALVAGALFLSGGDNSTSTIPIIAAPTPETRIKPVDPQGMELPHKDMEIYSYVDPEGMPQPKVERLIPAPQDKPTLPPRPAITAAQRTAQAPLANPTPPPLTPPARRPGVSGSLQPVASQPVPPVGGIPRAGGVLQTSQAAIPLQPQIGTQPQGSPAPTLAAPRPVAQPPVLAPSPATSQALVQPLTQPPAMAPVATTGTFRLQLGSLRDVAAAQTHWKTAQTRGGPALAGMQPQILKVEIPGKGTFFRVQAGSWPSRQEAQAVCESLKQAKVDCMVVR